MAILRVFGFLAFAMAISIGGAIGFSGAIGSIGTIGATSRSLLGLIGEIEVFHVLLHLPHIDIGVC
eukprot:CAMPEP_0201587630 /NCGR_PEP_ID=MMETSP0190_2-20130828/145668_1 /ASSEMBLY_ACC=CAM_ASM_000263 /TAXON_ID=37353 /ORGANISM="Rosalina sp." /LENGTH=65 /DNA_ID=CAMNT_0048038055 /DNA_START=69 /DNA_END=263 /DNA_ORIENTATION=-